MPYQQYNFKPQTFDAQKETAGSAPALYQPFQLRQDLAERAALPPVYRAVLCLKRNRHIPDRDTNLLHCGR